MHDLIAVSAGEHSGLDIFEPYQQCAQCRTGLCLGGQYVLLDKVSLQFTTIEKTYYKNKHQDAEYARLLSSYTVLRSNLFSASWPTSLAADP